MFAAIRASKNLQVYRFSVCGSTQGLNLIQRRAVRRHDRGFLLKLLLCCLTTANARMPGPRNPKRQKKLNALKEKKRKGSPPCKPVATPEVDPPPADPIPQAEKEKYAVVTVEQSAELDELEEMLLREPPVYDPGTGPRVKSMGEFLRSSFASGPTWDDELCAEFAQEEMVEMLRSVLPDEMALVSTQHDDAIATGAEAGGNESACGTTRADDVRASARRVGGYSRRGIF